MSSRTKALLFAAVTTIVAALALLVIVGDPARTGRTPTTSSTPPSASTSERSGAASAGTASTSGFAGAALPPGVRARPFALTALSWPSGAKPSGDTVTLAQFTGQVVVLAFLYPDCGRTCMLIADQVRGALDELRERPAVVIVDASQTIGGDARVRARAREQRFLEETSLHNRAYYLTGSRAQLRAVWHAYGVTPASAGKTRFEQYAQVLLIDGTGAERVMFGTEDLTAEGLAHDIRKLQSG